MLRALRRDLHLTADQAKARLIRADWASRLEPRLRQRLGKAFAGGWLADDGQEFVVAITGKSLEKVVHASGATPKVVARSGTEPGRGGRPVHPGHGRRAGQIDDARHRRTHVGCGDHGGQAADLRPEQHHVVHARAAQLPDRGGHVPVEVRIGWRVR